MSLLITKASGEKEIFDIKKFSHSLMKAGADTATINHLAQEIEHNPNLRNTKDIYEFAYQNLMIKQPYAGLRYNLKNALYELGPVGFTFEKYIAQLFKYQGFKIHTNKMIKGLCVTHEIDVLAAKDKTQALVECKFHAIPGEKVNIKIPLYVKARYDDLTSSSDTEERFNEVWIVTNTQFSDSSITYGNCADINLLGWGYPKKKGLEVLIDTLRLHPITILKSLSHHQKKELIKNEILLCKDIVERKDMLYSFGLARIQTNQILEECDLLINANVTLN